MIFGGWLTRGFAPPVAPDGSLCRPAAPPQGSPRPPINSYRQIIRFDDSMIIRFDDSMIFDSMIR